MKNSTKAIPSVEWLQPLSYDGKETTPANRPFSAIEQAVSANPFVVLRLDPNNPGELLIRPERNSRPTPEVGDKSILSLAEDIGSIGFNTQPALATIDPATGAADLYAGFRRARAIQTWNQSHPSAPILLHVLVTAEQMTEQKAFERSIGENVFRQEMNLMEKCAALNHLMSEAGGGLSMPDAAQKMNLTKSAASILVRCDFLPAVAKKALAAGKIEFRGATDLVAMLPKVEAGGGRSLKKAMEADPEALGEALKESQEKIAKVVTKQLEATPGKIKSGDIDRAVRKTAGKDGKAVKTTQRNVTAVVRDLKEYIEAQKEKAKEAKAEVSVEVPLLLAVLKYVGGGSLKGLVKALSQSSGVC